MWVLCRRLILCLLFNLKTLMIIMIIQLAGLIQLQKLSSSRGRNTNTNTCAHTQTVWRLFIWLAKGAEEIQRSLMNLFCFPFFSCPPVQQFIKPVHQTFHFRGKHKINGPLTHFNVEKMPSYNLRIFFCPRGSRWNSS